MFAANERHGSIVDTSGTFMMSVHYRICLVLGSDGREVRGESLEFRAGRFSRVVVPRLSEGLSVVRPSIGLQWQTERLISSTTLAVTVSFRLRTRTRTFSSTWRTLAARISKKDRTSISTSNKPRRGRARPTSFATNTGFDPSLHRDAGRQLNFLDRRMCSGTDNAE